MDESTTFNAIISIVTVLAFAVLGWCMLRRFEECRTLREGDEMDHETDVVEEFAEPNVMKDNNPNDGLNAIGQKMTCDGMYNSIGRSAPTCGLDLSKFGQMLTVQDMNAKGEINVQGRLHFGDPTMKKTPDMKANNSDPYYLQKVEHGKNRSTLDLTMNDDSDERFRIMGNACQEGPKGCQGPGVEKHFFQANGDAGHDGTLRVGKDIHAGGDVRTDKDIHASGVVHASGGVETDVFRFRKKNNSSNDKSSLEYNGNGGIDLYTDARFDIIESDNNRRAFRFDANNNRFCIGDTCIGENELGTSRLERRIAELESSLRQETENRKNRFDELNSKIQEGPQPPSSAGVVGMRGGNGEYAVGSDVPNGNLYYCRNGTTDATFRVVYKQGGLRSPPSDLTLRIRSGSYRRPRILAKFESKRSGSAILQVQDHERNERSFRDIDERTLDNDDQVAFPCPSF